MKTFLKLLFLFGVVLPAIGAQPPVIRNGWTTNAEALLPIRVYSPEYAYLGPAIVPNLRIPSSDTFFMGTLAGIADDGSANDSLGFGIGSLSVCSNGLGNVAFGGSTLNDLTNASGVLGIGLYNSAFGYLAGNGIDCGVDGIYIGRQTGPLHGGYYNICIGALSSYENLKTNTVSIGYNASSTGDNIFVLGDTNMDKYVFRGQQYTFPVPRGTNQYLFIGDAGQLYWTNVNTYTTNIIVSPVTNLVVVSNSYFYETNFVNYSYTTNLFVTSNAYFYETNFSSYAYTTNLFVESNAFFFETNFVNYEYVTNLTVVTNLYVGGSGYVSNLWATNVENLPGPFVLLPHAPTNSFPNALSLSNGTGINFTSNGQFLVVSATASGGGASIQTNGVDVVGLATNINFVPGAGVTLLVTNTDGDVDIGISASAGVPFATNGIEMISTSTGNVLIDCSTASWKWLTNKLTGNITLIPTNYTPGVDISVRFEGSLANNRIISYLWTPGVTVTWLSATQSLSLSNKTMLISIQNWSPSNVIIAGKESP